MQILLTRSNLKEELTNRGVQFNPFTSNVKLGSMLDKVLRDEEKLEVRADNNTESNNSKNNNIQSQSHWSVWDGFKLYSRTFGSAILAGSAASVCLYYATCVGG